MSLLDTQPKLPPYLTIIPDRRPEQKTHTSIGHAKSAISGKMGYRGARNDMQMYEYVDGGWRLLYDIKVGDLEPPWRVGEKEEANQKALRAKEAAQKRIENHALDLASARFETMDQINAYVEGYMQGREEYNER